MNEKTLDILLIEDTPSDAELLQRLLRRTSIHSSVQWVQSIALATEAITNNTFDVVLTDLGLPDSSGIATVVRLRELSDRLPIIALTGQDDDGVGQAAIQSGANDYVPKSELSAPIISRAISHTIERFQMARKIVDANRMLESKNERLSQMYTMSQQFVDNVSHEFRTPLTVIREFADIVRDGIDGPVTDKQKKRLSTLINRTDDLSNMVDDLLDTSLLETGLLKTCREKHKLSEIVGQVERMLRTRASNKKISLTVSDIPKGLSVFCDEEKLRRVLINLLVNAIKFTPVAGQIEITSSMADNDRVRITVSDNGPGIAADELKRIFERFQQVEAHHRMASCKGFGLGLSIARALASLNLGSLEVDSTPGQGSQFSVLVPIAKLDSVLNCYFDQRTTTLDENPEISRLEIYPECFDSEQKLEVIETLDEFLRSSVKSFDLVLKTQESRWLVFTSNSKSSLAGFKSRIESEWEKLRQNHFGAALPNLILEHKKTANVIDGREELTQLARRKSPAQVEPNAKPCQAKRILVVDDEVDVVSAIESCLRASGFEVTTANDGFSGLEAVDQLQPDAVLLDIRMPGMDGLTVLRHLKSNPKTASTPVVALSASLNDKQEVLDQGASYFVQKPFQSGSLLAALNSVIKNGETNPAELCHG